MYDYSCVIAGVGPAGAGFLFNLNQAGAIASLPGPVLLLERGSVLGLGRLGDYRITANSLGVAILECVEGGRFPGWIKEWDALDEVGKLRRHASCAPPLELVASVVADATERLVDHLETHGRVVARRRCSVELIRQRADGGFDVTWRDHVDGGTRTVSCASVVCNLGGKQRPEICRQVLERANVRVGAPELPVFGSDALLRLPLPALRDALELVLTAGRDELVLVGGSHSALSLVDRLTEAFDGGNLAHIRVLCRAMPRLYYASAEEANAAGYAFDPMHDVCPLSGRVNRFGGLRFRAKDVADSIRAGGRVDGRSTTVQIHRLSDSAAVRVPRARRISRVAALISCLGYEPNLPRFHDTLGRPVDPAAGESFDTDSIGRLLAPDGLVIEGMYCFGLGMGLRANPEAGGEPSFRGRMDGVWLYHFDIGRKVLGSFLRYIEKATDVAVPA